MKYALASLGGLGLITSVLGCTDGRLPAPVEQERNGIVVGTPSSPADDAVVAIAVGSNACTATLIAPDVILTALHCVSVFNPKLTFTCNPDGSLDPASAGGTLGPTVDPSTVTLAYGVMPVPSGIGAKAIYGTNSPDVCRDDIAVVVLDGNVPIGDAPLTRLRFDRTTKDGEPVRVIGYGQTDANAPGRNERDDLTILGVGSPNSVVKGDFGVAPRTLMVGEGACHGDSGGPLLSTVTGAEIGVYSLITTDTCQGTDVRNIYTQIAPNENLIRMALATVGEEPLLEVAPETGAGGEGGVTGQAGESSTAGVPGEAGSAPEATGGSGGGTTSGAGRGGSGGTGGSSPASTGGSTTSGDDTQSEAGAQGEGSGSRSDPTCTCRAGRTGDTKPWAAVGLVFAGLSMARRRRRR